MEPYWSDSQITLHLGDCIEVLREMADASVDAIVTDPPYNLSDGGFRRSLNAADVGRDNVFGRQSSRGPEYTTAVVKRDRDCLRRIIAQVDLPDLNNGDAEDGQGFHLPGPALGGTDLGRVLRATGVGARVGVPECPVDLDGAPVGEQEVGAGDVAAERSTDGGLPAVADAEAVEYLGDYILELADGGHAPFCDGSCSCFTEPCAGVIGVAVTLPGAPGSDEFGGVLSRPGTGGEHVGLHDYAGGQAEAAPEVLAGRGTVTRAVLRLDLRRRTGELHPARGTYDGDALFTLTPAKAVGAGTGAGRLPSVAEPDGIGLVSASAGRAFTLHFPWHAVNPSRQAAGFMGKAWDGWESPAAFQRWCLAWARECLRVLKPGGYMLAFGGCYDAETEVLTARGWVPMPDVTMADLFASLDPDTHEVEWVRPVEIVQQPHHGPMHRYRTNRVDLLVTPNHKMFVAGLGTGNRKFQLRRSDEIPAAIRMTKTSAGRADATEVPFVLPSASIGVGHGHRRLLPEVEIPARAWAAFLGLWMAEGHASVTASRGGESSHIAITHYDEANVAEMAAMLAPYFNVCRYPASGRLRINDRRMYEYLRQFGQAPDKWLPGWLKSQPPAVLRIFLDWYSRGDGDAEGRIYTASRRLANDVQEIAMYAGWAADVSMRQRTRGGMIAGRPIRAVHPQYVIRLLRAQTRPEVYDRAGRHGESGRSVIPASEWGGRFVYCVELERHHTLYVRRAGKAVWCGNTRTWHRLACAIEDAGFEIRDSTADLTGIDGPGLIWAYGQGFAKSLDAARAVDMHVCTLPGRHCMREVPEDPKPDDHVCPESAEGESWRGYGTAWKPAWEPIVCARKPLAGTLAANLLAHGTGALNIDAGRVGSEARVNNAGGASSLQRVSRVEQGYRATVTASRGQVSEVTGRWPPNLVLAHSPECRPAGQRLVQGDKRAGQAPGHRPGGFGDVGADSGDGKPNGALHGPEVVQVFECSPRCPVAEMDRQSGMLKSGGNITGREPSGKTKTAFGEFAGRSPYVTHGDNGGASRFFPVFRYEAKASQNERPRLEDGTAWPTVKPLPLVRWLVRLVTPPRGKVLDLFAGTGPTAEACIVEGFDCILIDKDPVAAALIRERLSKDIQPDIFGGAA